MPWGLRRSEASGADRCTFRGISWSEASGADQRAFKGMAGASGTAMGFSAQAMVAQKGRKDPAQGTVWREPLAPPVMNATTAWEFRGLRLSEASGADRHTFRGRPPGAEAGYKYRAG